MERSATSAASFRYGVIAKQAALKVYGVLSARIFASIIVTEESSPANGPPFIKAVNVGVLEDIADPHIDPFARRRFTQAPRELGNAAPDFSVTACQGIKNTIASAGMSQREHAADLAREPVTLRQSVPWRLRQVLPRLSVELAR